MLFLSSRQVLFKISMNNPIAKKKYIYILISYQKYSKYLRFFFYSHEINWKSSIIDYRYSFFSISCYTTLLSIINFLPYTFPNLLFVNSHLSSHSISNLTWIRYSTNCNLFLNQIYPRGSNVCTWIASFRSCVVGVPKSIVPSLARVRFESRLTLGG